MRLEAGAVAVALAAATTLMYATPTAAQQDDERNETLEVSPTSGPPGTVITVQGEDCTTTDPGLEAVLVNLIDENTQQPVIPFIEAPAGSWSIQLTIPQEIDPDHAFAITASCVNFDSPDTFVVVFDYEPVAFDVTEPPTAAPPTTAPPTTTPPAEPVAAEPTFTG
jgi:hypothetical protein